MVDVAQLVRALVCGTKGRGFESHLPPITGPVLSPRPVFLYPYPTFQYSPFPTTPHSTLPRIHRHLISQHSHPRPHYPIPLWASGDKIAKPSPLLHWLKQRTPPRDPSEPHCPFPPLLESPHPPEAHHGHTRLFPCLAAAGVLLRKFPGPPIAARRVPPSRAEGG